MGMHYHLASREWRRGGKHLSKGAGLCVGSYRVGTTPSRIDRTRKRNGRLCRLYTGGNGLQIINGMDGQKYVFVEDDNGEEDMLTIPEYRARNPEEGAWIKYLSQHPPKVL